MSRLPLWLSWGGVCGLWFVALAAGMHSIFGADVVAHRRATRVDLGEAEEQRTKIEEVSVLKQKVERDPDNNELLYDLARRSWWEVYDANAALKYYAKLRAHNFKPEVVAYDLAVIHEWKGHYAAQIQELRTFWDLHGKNATNHKWVIEYIGWWEELVSKTVVAAAPPQPPDDNHKFINSIGMSFVRIPAGEFAMGRDDGPKTERPLHKVAVNSFWLGEYEVTGKQFKRFLVETGHRFPYPPPNIYVQTDTHPMVQVNWIDAHAFTKWLSIKESTIYRLPTEAEWEFAARGTDGRLNPWGNGATTSEIANVDRRLNIGAAGSKPTLEKVGSYPEDKSFFGVFDMTGNAVEWCLDFWDPTFYHYAPVQSPLGPPRGKKHATHVLRGASWRDGSGDSFATRRDTWNRHSNYDHFGFRVVRED